MRAEQGVEYLGMCAQLTTLSLSSNPMCATPHLRRKVAAAVPQLQLLDDVPLDAHDRQVLC